MSSPASAITKTPIAVLGAGSWGTALAILLASNGQPTKLWGHDPAHMQQMLSEGSNTRYLPGLVFPANLTVCTDVRAALENTQDLLLVVPSRFFAEVLTDIKPHLLPTTRLVWGSKGLTSQQQLLHNAAADILPAHPLAVISGPSFAHEVARNLPCAVTLATTDTLFAQALTARFNNAYFRVYTTQDIVGVEACGVVKNILAIAAGIVNGLQLGANAQSALITRGLVEMKRFGMALGGKAETFTGLAGLGDLVLSCTDNQSRNRRFGSAIASGKPAAAILKEIGQAVEGYANLAAVYQLAQQLQIEMPITQEVYQVIYANKSPKAAINSLFTRATKSELD